MSTVGICTIFLAVNNYTADTYDRLASSALAAQSLTRNILGGVFPLATEAMFSSLGTPGALSLLGGVVSMEASINNRMLCLLTSLGFTTEHCTMGLDHIWTEDTSQKQGRAFGW